LKKRTKKLLRLACRGGATGVPKGSKVFCFFFSKKKASLLPTFRQAARKQAV
jgi:hypothetical protein